MAQQLQVKKQNKPNSKSVKAADPVVSHAVPNTVFDSAQSDSNLAQMMEARMQSRFGQYDAAEREADRLSASVIGVSTPQQVKSVLGEQMGADFSGVRFHTGMDAAAKADAMGARAYATGRDVFFANGFEPEVAAHELVHTVQQGVVSADTSTISAPEGAVQMWKNPFRRKKQAEDAKVSDINADIAPDTEVKTLKHGGVGDGNQKAKVSKMRNTAGDNVIVKGGVNLQNEITLSDFYNIVGQVYAEGNPKSNWSIDAARVRGVHGGDEKEMFKRMYRGGVLTTDQPETDRQMNSEEKNLEDDLNKTAVFEMVNGESGEMKETQRTDSFTGEKYILKDLINFDERTKNVKSPNDFRHALGYIALADMVTGNGDRLYGGLADLNPENWLEESTKKGGKIHLIDNDYGAPESFQNSAKNVGVVNGVEITGHEAWKSKVLNEFAKSMDYNSGTMEAGGGVDDWYKNMRSQGLEGNRSAVAMGYLDDKYAKAGSKQAYNDLGRIRGLFYEKASQRIDKDGKLLPEDEEMLKRLDDMMKYITPGESKDSNTPSSQAPAEKKPSRWSRFKNKFKKQ